MAEQVLVLVGTRKGAFVLRSDTERKSWTIDGPHCEGWPVYHAVHDPRTGDLYAAAASEWHGSGVWRSEDLGRTWAISSEGLGYGAEDARKISKVSTVRPAGDRLLAGVEMAGVFQSTDRGQTWSLVNSMEGLPGSESWDDPSNQPPGHLGLSGLTPHPDDPGRFWAIVQGVGAFETADGGATFTPRNRGLRADWPREHEEVGFCVHKLVLAADGERMYQQNHVGMHRSDDAGKSWTEITEGLPTEFGFAAAAHPQDRDSFYVIPLDPGHGRCMPDGEAAVWRTSDAGSSWRKLTNGLPQRDAHLGVLREGMAIDALDSPGLYFGTSTGQVFASSDEGESWQEIASYLPAISSVEVAVL